MIMDDNGIDNNSKMSDSDPNNNASPVVVLLVVEQQEGVVVAEQQQQQQEQQRKLLLEAHLLDRLIRSNEWDRVYEVFHQYSCSAERGRTLNRIYWSSNDRFYAATRLHWICAIGSAPPKLIDLVASIDPHAVSLPNTYRHYDTPLHIIARHSQTSSTKMEILIKYLKQYDPQCEALETRTSFGGTVLHSAANHNAMLEVIQMIVSNNSNVLKVRTTHGIHAVSALWSSYVQTIPGHMIVARILAGDEDVSQEAHFQKLWKKAEFLASEYFARTRSAPPSLLLKKTAAAAAAANTDNSDDIDNEKKKKDYVLHGLLQCVSNVAINFFKVALRQPNSRITTNACDVDGNLPLHRLLRDRPFRLKEVEAVQDMVNANPHAVCHKNNDGDIPLTIAIRNKMSWDCIRPVVNANPDTVRYQYRDTNNNKGTDGAAGVLLLYPFQLAACVGGKYAFEITYQLLLIQPDLLSVKQQKQQHKEGGGP